MTAQSFGVFMVTFLTLVFFVPGGYDKYSGRQFFMQSFVQIVIKERKVTALLW
ncbi:MAG: hypothetical protein ACI81O_001670 [Cyclobacteriaceae bacterium]|jgi:hypothetical protein